MTEWDEAIEAAAKVAEAYAEENRLMAQDTIINDPILCGGPITERNLELAKSNMVDGCVHTSMFHAAQNIAAAIRELRTAHSSKGR